MRNAAAFTFLLTLSVGTLSAQFPSDMQSAEFHTNSDVSSNSSAIAAIMSPIAGQPYEAHKVTRSVWRLADGTTITHESGSQIARDSEGRIREELVIVNASSLGGKQLNHTSSSVTIGDPVDHSMLIWTGEDPKLVMRMALPQLPARPHTTGGVFGGLVAPPRPVKLANATGPNTVKPAREDDRSRETVHTEDLGKQSLAGVLATGKRTTTVIPIGKIGNDRPITVVHEEWYSPDLKIVVKSLDSDPRSGDRTMELEGVTRGDPSPALFQAPEGAKVTEMGDLMKSLGDIGRTPAAK
jgi:hypothetical protein